jgi:glycosyltransferase involved in cell wall biosynthesis
MPRDSVSVALAIGAAPYQKTLTSSLLQAGMLRRLFVSNPNLEIQDPNEDGSLKEIKRFPLNREVNRVVWGAWRRLPRKLRPATPVMTTVLLTDQLWSRWIPRCDVFHGWMGQSLACLRVAKKQGTITLVENAGRHPAHFHRASWQECERFNIPRKDWSPLLPNALIGRMEREYEICDRIVVSSVVAHRSFAEFGYADKAVIVATGVDAEFFSPRPRSTSEPIFRVCFAGRVELAKGAGYLLQAWKRLGLANAELVLAGEVRPEMRGLLQTDADSSVRTTGVLTAMELAELYRDSDVFAFPSVNEGLAQVLLEAMASGLPVVASDLSGASDCVRDGKEGFIVPGRNVDRIAQAILWCYEHRGETRAMGEAARAKIESQFTLEHYDRRMIALYRGFAGAAA